MSDSQSRIPECPYENLERMRGISARYHRNLERVLSQKAQVEEKLQRLREQPLPDDASERDKKQRATLERKHLYDLRLFGRQIGKLRGQITWADERQIPFLEEEVALADAEKAAADEDGEANDQEAGAGA